ncbi:MAG: ComF family protein [Marinilabiliaceae bacterium]|nr:ComF family protein [Marinilabiliaceae bacterium]
MKSSIYKNINIIKEVSTALFDLFFPLHCTFCNNELIGNENGICRQCEAELPQTYYDVLKNNPIEQMFWGRANITKATSLFFYRKGEKMQQLLKKIKYHNYKNLANVAGQMMGKRLVYSGFSNNIDLIIPVPLHQKKLEKRGYNQSLLLAEGISKITNIPVANQVAIRITETDTQTKKSRFERYSNMKNVFQLIQKNALHNKSVLLVDDVITTGSTIESLASCIEKEAQNTQINVATLAYAVFS